MESRPGSDSRFERASKIIELINNGNIKQARTTIVDHAQEYNLNRAIHAYDDVALGMAEVEVMEARP